jgi:hypothetical protein
MRETMHSAAARRDDRLARVRKLSLWITGGAAAASLGLGTAFAHAMPGHAATGSPASSAASQASGSTSAGKSASGASPRSSSAPARSASVSPSHQAASRSTHKLAQPASTPAPTQQQPVAQSGGS